MTEIIEKTKELGALLQQSEQVRKYTAAKADFDSDEKIQKLVREYNLHRMTMMSLTQAETQDPERIREAEERVGALYAEIMKNEKMQVMQEREKAVEELMNQINGVISYYITGEAPSGCTHDCSTCGGCH